MLSIAASPRIEDVQTLTRLWLLLRYGGSIGLIRQVDLLVYQIGGYASV